MKIKRYRIQYLKCLLILYVLYYISGVNLQYFIMVNLVLNFAFRQRSLRKRYKGTFCPNKVIVILPVNMKFKNILKINLSSARMITMKHIGIIYKNQSNNETIVSGLF